MSTVNSSGTSLLGRFLFTLLILLFLASGTAAVSAQGVWRVEVISGLGESEANEYLKSIPDIPNAQVLPHSGRFGVFAGSYSSESEARTAATDLATNAGLVRPNVVFFPAAIPSVPGGARSGEGRFRVLVGQFDNRADARERQARLEAKGFFPVDILEQNGIFRLYSGHEVSTRAEAERYAATLRDEDVIYDRIVNLNEPIAPPTPDLDGLARGYLGRIDTAIASSNFTEAERLLNEWEGVDPGNLQIPGKRREVAERRQAAATPVPTPRGTPPPTPQASEYELRRPDALAAEEEGRIEDAIAIWERILASTNLTEQQSSEARSTVNRLKQQLYADVPGGDGSAQGSSKLPLIIGGVVLLVVVLLIVVVVLKKRSSAAPAATPAPPALRPVTTPAKPVLATPPPPSNPPAPAKKTSPTEIPSTERIVPPTLQSEETQIDFSDMQDDTVKVEDDDDGALLLDGILGGDDEPAESSTQVEMPSGEPQSPAPSRIVPSDDNRRIPTIREDKTAPIISHEVPAPAPVAAVAATGPTPQKAPAPAKPVPSATPGRVAFYEQNFDEEPSGEMPANWTGEYDYATLKVVDRGDGSGKKCMRFEKQSGSGSAFYTCKFPDAAGRVVVEFDLRCDNKNKYLLGFYVEKDADFRHSIHTVVHRDVANMDKISLRLQNEAEAYNLGEWVHIRFLIDLPRNIVDGYINDRPVAVGVRLASKPRVVNTLSIRDNLATEGILMIDNIQIYQDRPN